MKTILLTLIVLSWSLTSGQGQSRYVTLVLNNKDTKGPVVLSKTLTLASNEVVVAKGYYGLSSGISCDVVAQGITYGTFSPGQLVLPLAGPAEIRLSTNPYSGTWYYCYLTLEIAPESFPPDKTLILPEGTVGTVHVESSTNLIDWQDEWSQTFSNTNQNRFFRLRAERSLP